MLVRCTNTYDIHTSLGSILQVTPSDLPKAKRLLKQLGHTHYYYFPSFAQYMIRRVQGTIHLAELRKL